MLIVKKFGGTSVASTEKIKNIAQKILKDYMAGHKIIVVLSAMGKTTDKLINLAREITHNPSKREMDMLYTTGEQVSVALLSMALHSINVPAVSLNAFQVKIKTNDVYGDARIIDIEKTRILSELDVNKVVIITGFQGINKIGDYTTLGRGGSDTTAVALAAALHAKECQIYTDVDGIYTADPNIIKTAKKIEKITYDEMLTFASLGAQVLHNRSVELAKTYGIKLIIKSSLTNNEGSIVGGDYDMEKREISGVVSNKNISKITVIGLKNNSETLFKLFLFISNENINIDMISQTNEYNGLRDISFTIAKDDFDDVIKILEKNKKYLEFKDIKYSLDLAKVSVVGSGMMINSGIATKFFEALHLANIDINMISTSEIRISVLIKSELCDKTVKVVHNIFENVL